jgi:hypothetical protein
VGGRREELEMIDGVCSGFVGLRSLERIQGRECRLVGMRDSRLLTEVSGIGNSLGSAGKTGSVWGVGLERISAVESFTAEEGEELISDLGCGKDGIFVYLDECVTIWEDFESEPVGHRRSEEIEGVFELFF